MGTTHIYQMEPLVKGSRCNDERELRKSGEGVVRELRKSCEVCQEEVAKELRRRCDDGAGGARHAVPC